MRKVKRTGLVSIILSSLFVMSTFFIGCNNDDKGKEIGDNTLIAVKKSDKEDSKKDVYISYDGKGFRKVIEAINLEDGTGAIQYFPQSGVMLYQDNSNSVYMVEKDSQKMKVASNPVQTIINNKKHVISMDKEGNLYYKAYNKQSEKIADNVTTARIADESSKILYTTKDNNLYLYDENKQKVKVAEGVNKFSFTDSQDTIFITKEDNNIYTCKLGADGKQELIGETEKYMFLTMDKNNNVYYFKDIEKVGEVYFADYYLKKPGSKEVKIIEKANSSQYDFQVINNIIYYKDKNDSLHSIGKDGKDIKELGKNVKNYTVDDQNNVAYLDKDDILNTIKEDKTIEKMDAKDKLYTMVEGQLYLVGADKTLTVGKTVISNNVEEIQISGNNLSYYTTDKKLYIWDAKNSKSIKVIDDITVYDEVFYGGNLLYTKEQ